MAQQNINQYVFNKFYLLPTNENMDLSLASDEKNYDDEVVFSDQIIAYFDGNRLPLQFDINDLDSAPDFTLNYKEFNPNNVLLSTNYWNPNNINLSCFSAFTLCDIGLTGIDNGLVNQMTGETITITNGLLSDSDKFNRLMFDRRMKLIQVTGYTSSPNERFSGYSATTLYEIVSKTGTTEGVYHELYGGFYQGFYKLFGYDYQVIPTRVTKGWTVELVVKPRLFNEYSPSSGETTLNEYYPENSNIFFYMGARAENKYYHYADGSPISDSGYTRVTSGLTCLSTCACSNTAITNSNCINIYPPSAITVNHTYGGCGYYNEIVLEPELDPAWDTISNAIAIKFCGNLTNPKLGVKVLRFVGDCVITGTCENTGITYSTGYTITEYCSPNGINDFCSGTIITQQENWYLIDVVFERDSWLDECDLIYKGGLGTITKFEYLDSLLNNSTALISPPLDGEINEQLEIIKLNEKWLLQKKYRKGKLKFYVNGKLFYTIDDFEEIIPRGENTRKERQIGVPFNISVGGGTQGLHEALIFTGCPTGLINTYEQDPELVPNQILSGTSLSGLSTNILLEPNFAGTFNGALAQFRMYIEPLSAAKIQHNFRILREKFRLITPFCYNCPPKENSVLLEAENFIYPSISVTGDSLNDIFNPIMETGYTISFCYKIDSNASGFGIFVIAGGNFNIVSPPYYTFTFLKSNTGSLWLSIVVMDGVNPSFTITYEVDGSETIFTDKNWHKITFVRNSDTFYGWALHNFKIYIDGIEKPLTLISSGGTFYDDVSYLSVGLFTFFGTPFVGDKVYFDQIYSCLTPRSENDVVDIIQYNLMDLADSLWNRQWWWRILDTDTNTTFLDYSNNSLILNGRNSSLSDDACN